MSFILCVFVGLTVILEFYRGAHVIAHKSGTSLLSSAVTLTRRNTRRYGGYIVHFGIVLMFIGFTGTAFNTEREEALLVGEQMELPPYSFRLAELMEADNPNFAAEHAVVELYRGGRQIDVMYPERRFYKASRQPSTEAAIRPRLNEDIYVVFAGMEEDQQRAVINVHINPLVNWIWLGCLVVVLGTVIALVPSRPGLDAGRKRKDVAAPPEEQSLKEKEHDEVPA